MMRAISRRRLLVVLPAALLTACGSASDSPVTPSAGRPTFILFYAQG